MLPNNSIYEIKNKEMNTIKTLTRYALYTLLVVFVVGCITVEDKTETTPKRIILKEATNVNGYMMYIVEIEGKEFFVNGRGGIQPLGNCN